jgi:hypothetical protein
VAALVVPTHRRPPAIYRLARALRWVGALVFVALVVYAATVAYSAVEVARSSAQSHGLSASFAANGTIEISGSFILSNPGLYPIESLRLTASVANATGVFLGKTSAGPTTVTASSNATFPLALYLPVSSDNAAVSLLTEDQNLRVNAWANATYAYLFPLSVGLSENRSWGAPFEGLTVMLGAPSGGGGTVTVPVTLVFSNHAGISDVGTLTFVIQAASLADCGGGAFTIDVPPGAPYDQTQDVTLGSGCSPAGGQILSTYSTGGTLIPLPPEPIS